MSDLAELLEDYDGLIQRYRAIMEKELRSLRESGELDESLNEAKQTILQDLGVKLASLKEFQTSGHGADPGLKSRLDRVQHQFMQVIKLDREVEKEYLGRQSSRTSALRSIAEGSGDRAAARRLYGR